MVDKDLEIPYGRGESEYSITIRAVDSLAKEMGLPSSGTGEIYTHNQTKSKYAFGVEQAIVNDRYVYNTFVYKNRKAASGRMVQDLISGSRGYYGKVTFKRIADVYKFFKTFK